MSKVNAEFDRGYQAAKQLSKNKIKQLEQKLEEADSHIRQGDYILDMAGREITALQYKVEDLESNIKGLTATIAEYKKRELNGNV